MCLLVGLVSFVRPSSGRGVRVRVPLAWCAVPCFSVSLLASSGAGSVWWAGVAGSASALSSILVLPAGAGQTNLVGAARFSLTLS